MHTHTHTHTATALELTLWRAPSYDMGLSLMPPKASELVRSCSRQDGWLSSSGSQYQECPSLEVWFCGSVLKMSEQCTKFEVCGRRNAQITAVRRQRAPVLAILSLSPIYWVGVPSLCPYSGHLLLPQVILFGNAPTDKLWRMPLESSIQSSIQLNWQDCHHTILPILNFIC